MKPILILVLCVVIPFFITSFLVKRKSLHQLQTWSYYASYFGTMIGVGSIGTASGIKLGGFAPQVVWWESGSSVAVALLMLGMLLQMHVHERIKPVGI